MRLPAKRVERPENRRNGRDDYAAKHNYWKILISVGEFNF
jgi:hypothetical protein